MYSHTVCPPPPTNTCTSNSTSLPCPLHSTQVNYREGISRSAEVRYVHKKQSGGSGQFADVAIRFEPAEVRRAALGAALQTAGLSAAHSQCSLHAVQHVLAHWVPCWHLLLCTHPLCVLSCRWRGCLLQAGTGFEFRSDIKGGVVPKEYIPGVTKVGFLSCIFGHRWLGSCLRGMPRGARASPEGCDCQALCMLCCRVLHIRSWAGRAAHSRPWPVLTAAWPGGDEQQGLSGPASP